MEKFRLTSNGHVYKQGNLSSSRVSTVLPSIIFKPTKTSQLRSGASLPELNAANKVHKFPAGRKQATLARLDSRDDTAITKPAPRKELSRQRSKSHDPDTRKNTIRIKGSLPALQSSNVGQNIFNGNTILWKHQLPVLVSLFLHDDFDCIEVITYDLTHNAELERLYVIASQIFSIVENYSEIAALYCNKIAKSEPIVNARINCTIDYLMSHLGSEKVAFMPVVPTLRRYNEKTRRRVALTVPKPLWLVPGQVDPVCQIIGVLLGKTFVHTAAVMNIVKLRWRWAIKKVIGTNRAKANIIYAWRRATMSTNLLNHMKRGDSLEEVISTVNSGAEDDASDASFLTDSEESATRGLLLCFSAVVTT